MLLFSGPKPVASVFISLLGPALTELVFYWTPKHSPALEKCLLLDFGPRIQKYCHEPQL